MVGHIVLSFFFALLLFLFAFSADTATLFNGAGKKRKKRKASKVLAYGVASLLVGAVGFCYADKRMPALAVKEALAVPSFVVMLAVCLAIMLWWGFDGSRGVELILFVCISIPVVVLLFSTGAMVAGVVTDYVLSPILAPIFAKVIPWTVTIIMAGWFPACMIVTSKTKREGDSGD